MEPTNEELAELEAEGYVRAPERPRSTSKSPPTPKEPYRPYRGPRCTHDLPPQTCGDCRDLDPEQRMHRREIEEERQAARRSRRDRAEDTQPVDFEAFEPF